MQLETERLLLRQFKQEDFEEYAAMVADPETMLYVGQGKPMTRSEAWRSMAAILGHWQLRGYGLYAVIEKSSQRLAGRIGLLFPEGWPGIELGWMLAPEFRGKGFALEAAQAVQHHAFHVLQIPELISVIHPENRRSIKLAMKLGETLYDYLWLFNIQCAIYKVRYFQG
ncbi:GNAT family N-acetyltransferase [candidate division KSB1 bacterium]|nr:GNAT family N-acetyltransferase [candidate division KSB1 bacterium]